MNLNPKPLIVAERYGVILGVGDTKEAAAAAAAAARVSRVEMRYATAREYGLWLDGRLGRTVKRLRIDSERALLEAVLTDIERVLFAADEHTYLVEPEFPEYREPEFPEYRAIDIDSLDDDGYNVLIARRKAINDELRELAFFERQSDLFAAVPA